MADRSAIVGNYEQVQPGKKIHMTLNLKPDGTVLYTETGETAMEKWSSKGDGHWRVEGSRVDIIFDTLSKEMKFKIKTNVPGIEDGVSTQHNISLPVTYKELAEAPRHGANKWRRV
eukprot:CAMPEP_0177648224 /NCGR_PEP_ID=MMETSP0447-20121125/10718_1 /TAXON_ID=0 /ORGANISM="Stygamoeba regulata, Strain BSH-02190019" /LENGTH=115 /DNA_ID=CAMNT_0019150859 /DNA_START=60 /DNA_END=407 /DNA_ORIENTATION=-